ncbi:hypothetical protein S245_004423 [Arachis hypogaea]|nr:uncharacterized protein DS421_2g42690 [Arachis hypogaea]
MGFSLPRREGADVGVAPRIVISGGCPRVRRLPRKKPPSVLPSRISGGCVPNTIPLPPDLLWLETLELSFQMRDLLVDILLELQVLLILQISGKKDPPISSSKNKLKTLSWQERRKLERDRKQKEEDEQTLA